MQRMRAGIEALLEQHAQHHDDQQCDIHPSMHPIRYPPDPRRGHSNPDQRPQRQHCKRQQIHIPDKPHAQIRLDETGQCHICQRPGHGYRHAQRVRHGRGLGHAQSAAAQERHGHDASSYTEERGDGADAYAAGGYFLAIQSAWDDPFTAGEKAASEQAVDDGHAEVGDEGVADDLAADPHRGDRTDDRTEGDEAAERPQVLADQVAGPAVFVGGDQGVDDHHAGRGGDGNVHRRLDDGVVGAMAGAEHAIEQRHDDEAAAETEEHGGDAGHTAEKGQQEVEHGASSGGGERSTIERRSLACFSNSANNVCVYANHRDALDAQYFDQSVG